MIDVGHTVGNYEVRSKLGEGGMGAVYLVEHPIIGRRAALKAVHPEFARNLDVVSRFINEAKAINQIGHDHIVDITDFGTTQAGDFYFIMEYLDGRSLADWIRHDGRLRPERALHVAAQIADALQASHNHGVIHRDLKPDNIFLITHNGAHDFVKVLDFGLAKLVGTDRRPAHNTRSGTVFGTPFYMAPEQCEGKVEIDHRADIYALGVILFEMVTGKLPFGGTGFGEIICKHMTVTPPAARSLVPDLPLAIDEILFRALAKNPAHRFQSMTEMRSALLDPDGYSESWESSASRHNISGRFQAARPMARSELSLPPPVRVARSSRSELSLPPPVRVARSSRGPGGGAGGRSLVTGARSTVTGVGEIAGSRVDAIPRARYGAKVALAVTAVVAVVILQTSGLRRPVAGVVAAAQALRRPSLVRLSFGSDPEGADVIRADGVRLGKTPLTTDVLSADVPSIYVLHKSGYSSKTVSVVPNLPTQVFTALPREVAAAAPVIATAPPAVISPAAAPLVTRPVRRAQARRPPPVVLTSTAPSTLRPEPMPVDEDGVLEPTIH
jgi:serine/threonine protein kinase